MSEKHLTELPWKTLAVKHKIKDATLQKALAKFGAAKEDDHEGRLKLLKEIEGCCDDLKKEQKANKEIVAYLEEIDKEADKSRKAIELLKKSADKKPTAKPAEAEDDEDTGLDLKGKLLSAMKKVKMRKPEDPPVEALVCQAGAEFAVLMAKKVGGGQKTELLELLKKATGHKFFKGTCEYGEMDTYTFVLETVPSGAKKGLTAFFKEHTAITYKLQVRDPARAMDADVADKADQATAEPMGLFKKRFEGMLPRIKEAIAAAGPTALGIKLKASEAGVFANKKDFAKANELLDEVETALKKSAATSPTGTDQAEARKPATVSEEFRKKWAAAKQAWQSANETVDAQIANLQSALKKSKDDELQEIAEFGLNGVTGNFKIPLMAVLKDIDDANSETLPTHTVRLRAIITGFRKHITSSPTIEACDENPFDVKMSIRQTIGGGLDKLEEGLAAAA